ncbi:MAG TPA: hypothetical protein VFA76_07840 [Terriglobales bacterium]|nr:hypothetical protein [Terriglobales bacterium]
MNNTLDTATAALIVTAALAFSFAIALVVEEIVCAGLFRVMFARQVDHNKTRLNR